MKEHLEFLKEYAKFGIYYNHSHNEIQLQKLLRRLNLAIDHIELAVDDAYGKGYGDATKEACDEIAKNYHPNEGL